MIVKMNHEEQREEINKIIFEQFAKICPYSIQFNSIKARKPPEPDIFCRCSDGSQMYFELTECIDKDFAEGMVRGVAAWIDDPSAERLSDKFKKKYTTNGHPVDLIVYYEIQQSSLLELNQEKLSHVKKIIENELNKGSIFNRIWVYSVAKNKILLVFPKL